MQESTGASIEAFLKPVINYISIAIEIAIAIIITGIVVVTLVGIIRVILSRRSKREEQTKHIQYIRYTLIRGLLIALDFVVAADILKTILAPSSTELATLVVVVVIRILLSWSLTKEIQSYADHLDRIG
jgi:uncharacterized membrane protein